MRTQSVTGMGPGRISKTNRLLTTWQGFRNEPNPRGGELRARSVGAGDLRLRGRRGRETCAELLMEEGEAAGRSLAGWLVSSFATCGAFVAGAASRGRRGPRAVTGENEPNSAGGKVRTQSVTGDRARTNF